MPIDLLNSYSSIIKSDVNKILQSVDIRIGVFFMLCALAMVLSDEGAKEQQPPAMLVRLKSLD